LWIITFTGTFFGMYMLGSYKNLGSVKGGIDDMTLTIYGIFAAIIGLIAKIVWSTLIDKYGFKLICSIILIIQIILSITIYQIV
jgi:hypothetical protein